jgi:sarcosine oxidase
MIVGLSGSNDRHQTCDVVVLGLGIMGASTLFHLSRRGVRALGIEAHGPLNSMGSSHGQSRIFRRAYWEGDHYVPLLNRSYAGWWELDDALPDTIARQTGGLFLGPASSTLVQGSRATAMRCGIEHECLDGPEIRDRFPAFQADDDVTAVYEPQAMVLDADRSRLGLLSRAVSGGARIAYGHTVQSVTQGPNGSVIVTGDGWRITCGAVVVTVGAWIGRLLPHEIAPLITPMRIPVYTFGVRESRRQEHRAGNFPIFLFENHGGALVYGLPESGSPEPAVKIGFHNRQLTPIDVDGERWPPTATERAEVWREIRGLFPGLRDAGRSIACVYTMSADEGFLMGRSREIEGVVYASACSGHGFKFAPGIGEVLAQLAIDGRSELDISVFDPARLAAVRTMAGKEHGVG